MTIKAVLENLDGLSEDIAGLYTEKNGKFVLEIEGMTSKDKLDEFRSNNVKLMKDIKALEDKFGNIDLKEYEELKKAAQEASDKNLLDEGKVEELLEQRTQRMREEMQNQIDSLSSEKENLSGQLQKLVIDNATRAAASKAGVVDTAVDDVLSRVRGTFKLEGDKAVPYENGSIVYGSDGETPLTIDDWVGGLKKSAPHLFPGSNGTGSQHQSNQSSGGSKTLNREGFEKLSQIERAKFFREGGTLVDE